jgi:hypothetical protein
VVAAGGNSVTVLPVGISHVPSDCARRCVDAAADDDDDDDVCEFVGNRLTAIVAGVSKDAGKRKSFHSNFVKKKGFFS